MLPEPPLQHSGTEAQRLLHDIFRSECTKPIGLSFCLRLGSLKNKILENKYRHDRMMMTLSQGLK